MLSTVHYNSYPTKVPKQEVRKFYNTTSRCILCTIPLWNALQQIYVNLCYCFEMVQVQIIKSQSESRTVVSSLWTRYSFDMCKTLHTRAQVILFNLKSQDLSYWDKMINFRAIILVNLGHVVPNRRAGIRQYTPSVSTFALRFFSVKKAGHKVNKVSLFSVFIFFNI